MTDVDDNKSLGDVGRFDCFILLHPRGIALEEIAAVARQRPVGPGCGELQQNILCTIRRTKNTEHIQNTEWIRSQSLLCQWCRVLDHWIFGIP